VGASCCLNLVVWLKITGVCRFLCTAIKSFACVVLETEPDPGLTTVAYLITPAFIKMSDPVVVSASQSNRRRQVCPSTNILQGNGADALDETLGRLSKKPGVKATMVLDRSSGAILKTSGQVSSIRKAKQLGSPQPGGSFAGDPAIGASGQDQGAEELASMVWNFIATAGSLVQELDTEVPSITFIA
jgi:dynein light chain roadblock-type